MRVLVVDDDESIRAVLAETLGDEGHEVAQAADGADALALVGTWPPDLILLDLLMPRMDGWDFLAVAHQRAPVILLTATQVTPDGTVAGRPLPPVAGVLPKPFNISDLLAAWPVYCPLVEALAATSHHVTVQPGSFGNPPVVQVSFVDGWALVARDDAAHLITTGAACSRRVTWPGEESANRR